MPTSHHDDDLLLICCPSCGQRFKIEDDLRGRTVECGGCEHRFRINDEVIVRGKKFYPGERKDPRLNRFHRIPLSMGLNVAVPDPIQYADAPDPVSFEPPAPQRVIAGAVGVIGMIFVALLLMFGTGRGSMLDGMMTQNRILMAGFAGLLGMVMLVYANPRARVKATVFGLLLAGCLVCLPMFFTEGSVPLEGARLAEDRPVADPDPDPDPVAGDEGDEPESESVAALRAAIGTDPLVKEIKRLAAEGSPNTAVGLWLRDLEQHNRLLIRDYVVRVTGADEQTHYFPRGGGDFLLVVTGVDLLLEEMAEFAAAVGVVEKVYPEISVVEVRINNDRFVEGSIEKLSDQNDPAFYDLNKRELESIDLQRVAKAVQRLGDAEPKIYRSDISRKLISLLGTPGVDFKADICSALSVWSDEPGAAGKAALIEAEALHEKKYDIPVEMVTLIVKEKTPGILPIVDDLWVKKPNQWEFLYSEIGNEAEATLIRRFPFADGAQIQSLVRLLGKVGGKDSLPVLERALPDANAELKVLIRNAMESIGERDGQ